MDSCGNIKTQEKESDIMPRIYTEFRISHKTLEDKKQYEQKLDDALKKAGYKSRSEWINEKYRELIKLER